MEIESWKSDSMGSDNGLVPDGTKPLSDPMMAYDQENPQEHLTMCFQWSLLLTWFNFNPSMDK